MNSGNFRVGSAVRFRAEFTAGEQPRDPRSVTATVKLGGRVSSYTQGTGIKRDAQGVYSVVIVLGTAGDLVVRFQGDQGFSETRYTVGEAIANPQPTGAALVPQLHADERLERMNQQNAIDDELEERRKMVKVLAEKGINIPTTRSFAYVKAAYDQIQKRA